ncbi:MAG: transaldolase [Pseudomonadota bacterium]
MLMTADKPEQVTPIDQLSVKIFADGADLSTMVAMAADPLIKGLTTNPTLMNKAGITDYEAFAKEVLAAIPDKPISFEVFSDDFEDMARQARQIASWGDNVYVKIPVSNTKGDMAYDLCRELAAEGIKLNVTALLTENQITAVIDALNPEVASYISVFAGRIADTGRDPVPLMAQAVKQAAAKLPKAEYIWASPRELLNIYQADQVGVQVITVTSDILKKLPLIGRDLDEYSLDTVAMFYKDAQAAGYQL